MNMIIMTSFMWPYIADWAIIFMDMINMIIFYHHHCHECDDYDNFHNKAALCWLQSSVSCACAFTHSTSATGSDDDDNDEVHWKFNRIPLYFQIYLLMKIYILNCEIFFNHPWLPLSLESWHNNNVCWLNCPNYIKLFRTACTLYTVLAFTIMKFAHRMGLMGSKLNGGNRMRTSNGKLSNELFFEKTLA